MSSSIHEFWLIQDFTGNLFCVNKLEKYAKCTHKIYCT